MKTCSKALLGCLILSSFVGAAQSFPEMARHGGELLYHTGRPISDKYLADANVIHNYHHYHLDKPVDGYEWVHGEENDYLLVAVKTHIVRRIEYRLNIPKASDG
ncbi:RcnB family protein [Dyella nitratireducens]|uniref:Nickel/cobalt transporter regulator n=1 Tax=Dyella nitratireducens TaxID=1849580 RepID=A0ABQ1GTA8_9GAMM|nr:RcnB family protein [Dyella nitratireducens]GGA49972.1 hypothetical protein GCM10010981_44100 [Dyella nitratireducens]GLQ42525.1 hypothetical protein GCM10007902_23750 [Dyella nitratireducens]